MLLILGILLGGATTAAEPAMAAANALAPAGASRPQPQRGTPSVFQGTQRIADGVLPARVAFGGGAWDLVERTSTVVRSVMIILLIASIATWTIWLVTGIELVRARKRVRPDLILLRRVDSLAQVRPLHSEAGRLMVEAVQAELQRSPAVHGPTAAEGVKERAAARLISVETALGRRMARMMSFIASIGSTAPFIGLFGTVWGIMESFIGITNAQSTNLQVIAPGIADALLTTAMGLATAIPAVLIYNGLLRSITGYRAQLADLFNAAVCVLSLDLERRTAAIVEQPVLARQVSHGI